MNIKKRMRIEREGSRKQALSVRVMCLCLGIAVGCLVSNDLKYTGIILQERENSDAPDTGGKRSNGSNHGGDVEKMRRYWKYSQTYRYIPPASRYHYIPVPAKECGASPTFDPWWKLSGLDRSRVNEDKFIYETFFNNQTADNSKGTYVELGAFDGRRESNTRFFDLCLGWKGLLIEGNPANYEKTISNRPYAHKMSLAPSCSAEYEAVNKTIQFYRYPLTNVGLVGHANAYVDKDTVDVPCGPLSPILEDMFADDNDSGSGTALPTLDFFSLDSIDNRFPCHSNQYPHD